MVPLRALCLTSILVLTLAGCDQISEQLNKQKAVGKAIGAACRQSGRSLEDCYNRNPKVSKPDIFTGWKEMSEYMQKQKLDVIPPPPDPPKVSEEDDAEADANASSPAVNHASAAASAVKAAEKPTTKASAKH